MKIQLVSIEKDGVIHVSVDGKITSQDFFEGNTNPLETTIGAGWAANRVLMDMTRVNYADSSAIGWLLQLQKGFKSGGGAVAFYGVTQSVMQLFTLLNLKSVLRLADNEAAARDMVATAAR